MKRKGSIYRPGFRSRDWLKVPIRHREEFVVAGYLPSPRGFSTLILGQFNGTKPWTDVEADVVIPSGTRLLQVQAIRQRSLRFDNKIGGTAWIDDLRCEPNPHRKPYEERP
jgi:ATP-dependent DNA ligase